MATSSVRLALERIVCQKGKGAVASLKVKAHVDPGSPEAHITAPRGILVGNAEVDEATSRGMASHPAELREFVAACEGRIDRYIVFLSHLARLMVGVARRASEGIKAMISEKAVPESIFGRKRMARAVVVRIPAQADGHLKAGGDGGAEEIPHG